VAAVLPFSFPFLFLFFAFHFSINLVFLLFGTYIFPIVPVLQVSLVAPPSLAVFSSEQHQANTLALHRLNPTGWHHPDNKSPPTPFRIYCSPSVTAIFLD
jgi:hypothetical protein